MDVLELTDVVDTPQGISEDPMLEVIREEVRNFVKRSFPEIASRIVREEVIFYLRRSAKEVVEEVVRAEVREIVRRSFPEVASAIVREEIERIKQEG
ncbi:MAG: hypothetical protein K9K75_00410 [Deltaproteobacteria bacterium]|nr:hypothetical protein [Deltaproteobacteria bacterium]